MLEDSSTALLRVLRRTRDETQLTQLLAAIASDDDVAAELARMFVAAAPNEAQREALGEVPSVLHCRQEASLKSATGDGLGRVDLRFDDDVGEFTLLVELKLHSAYGTDQVERYREALRGLPRDRRAALLSVTRNIPGVGEPPADTEKWLGSLRWTDIYSPLRELNIKNKDLAQQWRLLLGLIYEQGDFGVTELDRAEVEGWSAYARTREKLERLIEDLAPKALEELQGLLAHRDVWREMAPEGIATLQTRGQVRKVAFPTKTTVQTRFSIPAAEGHERLRIQFLGGYDTPAFSVEARRSGAAELLSGQANLLPSQAGAEKFANALRSLREDGFKTDERSYVARTHGANEWLYGSDAGTTVGERLLELISRDLYLLAHSGILDPDSGFAADRGQVVEEEQPVDVA